jgi:hypothetical protein
MDATQTAKAIRGHPNAFEVWQFNPAIVPNHHIFDVTTSIDERAYLSPRLMRQLGELTREFRSDNLLRGNSSGVKLFDPAKLIGFQARSVSDYVLDGFASVLTAF